jgi:hypothetical protein
VTCFDALSFWRQPKTVYEKVCVLSASSARIINSNVYLWAEVDRNNNLEIIKRK